MAQQLLSRHVLVGYADDLWRYRPETGLHHRLAPSACRALVERELVALLGPQVVGSRYTAEVLESVKNLAHLDDGATHPPFWKDTKASADVLPVRNGLVDFSGLMTGGQIALRPFDPNLFAVAGSPCSFDPTAKCPKWRSFVRWMVRGNEGEARLLAEYFGWTFVSHLPGMRYEKLLWLVGPGQNGKSLFFRVLRAVLGPGNCSAVGLDAFSGGEAFRLQPALYKLANFSADAAVRRSASVAMINAFVSGDPFVVNRKFREQLLVEPTTTLYVGSNDPPAFTDSSNAIWRRLLLIRCDRRLTPQQAKPRLFHTLVKERDGILQWGLSALPDLIARGRFQIPESIERNVTALQREANASRQFLGEEVEQSHPEDYLECDVVMAKFGEWCERNGFRVEPVTTMKAEMIRLFGSVQARLRRGNPPRRMRLWPGVRWQSDPDYNPFEADPTLSSDEAKLREWNRRTVE
jgi:putative DNA primase/helicase